MTRCKEYKPEYGYKYQLLVKTPYERAFESLDYAKDRKELNYLIQEYRIAYHNSCLFKSILLPKKYWNEIN